MKTNENRKAMLIVLTGYMGSGKTAVGKRLAEKMEVGFTDLDDVIAQQEGRSISDIFRIKKEIYFRKKERFYLEKILTTKDKTVLALGGGTPCYGGNMELILSRTPHVFYLKAGVATLLQRLEKEQHSRPLLKDIKKEDLSGFIRKHLFERSYFYLKAPHIIAVDGLLPGEIAEEIIKRLPPEEN